MMLGLILLMSLACSSVTGLFQGEGPSPGEESGEEALAEGELRCQQEGYPCSYAQAEPEALARGLELMELASGVLEQGGTIVEAGQRLEGERAVVDLQYDRLALRFRVEGGPPLWLIDPALMASDQQAAAGTGELARPIRQDDGPIGDQEEGEEPTHRALLLEPFLWDFQTNEASIVNGTLRQERNYECDQCRRLIENETAVVDPDDDGLSIGAVNLADFQNWDKFDLIHVSTHGAQICQGELDLTPESYQPYSGINCYTGIFTGISLTGEAYEDLSRLPAFSVDGVLWAKHPDQPSCAGLTPEDEAYQEQGCAGAGRWWQMVTADFFRRQYPEGLDEKFIFISACESMKGDDLAAALAGENTTVLGWTESIDAGISADVSTKFYEYYIDNKLVAETAYEKTKEQVNSSELLTRLKPKGGGSFQGAAPEIVRGGSPEPRGHEVVTLIHPVYQEELEDGSVVPVNGTAGDGEPDRLGLLVRLDGVEEDQSPEDFRIHLKVEDKEADETFSARHQVGEYSYWALPVIELPQDVAEMGPAKIETWVDLPEGGQSRHVIEEVELAGCGWVGQMSGARSGPISGHEIMNFQDVASTSPEDLEGAFSQFADPQSLSQMGPMLGQVGDLPLSLSLVAESGTTFMTADAEGRLALSFSPLEIYASQGGQFTIDRQTEEALEGSISGGLVRPGFGDTVNMQADYSWHKESFCGFGVKLAIAQNPLPEDLLAGGFGPQPGGLP